MRACFVASFEEAIRNYRGNGECLSNKAVCQVRLTLDIGVMYMLIYGVCSSVAHVHLMHSTILNVNIWYK